MNRSLVLQATLVAVIALFFALLYLAFLGESPTFSLRANLFEEELRLRLAKSAELYTDLELRAKKFLDENELGPFFNPRVATTPAPLAAPKKKNSQKVAASVAPKSTVKTPPLNLPEDVRYLLITDASGSLVYAGEAGKRVPYVKSLRGFSLDAEARVLYLILPYSRNRQFLGNVYFAFDYTSLLRKESSLQGSALKLRDVGLTEGGTAVFNYSRESMEKGFSSSLDERVKESRDGKGQVFISGKRRSFVFGSVQPFPIKIGILYENNALGLPPLTLVFLLITLAATGVLFFLNYRELSQRSESRRLADNTPLEDTAEATSSHAATSFKLDEEETSESEPERTQPSLQTAPPPRKSAVPMAFDLDDVDGDPSDEIVEIPDEVFTRKGKAVDPQLRHLIEDVKSPESSGPTVEHRAPVIPEKSEVALSPKRVPPRPPAPKKTPKKYPEKMTFLAMAAAIQEEDRLFLAQRNILKSLDRKFPGLAQCKILILIQNFDEGFIPFQWRDFDPRTRSLFRIPKKNHLVETFFNPGKILHIDKKIGRSRQLRSWISAEDLMTIEEIAFIPILKRKKVRFVCAVAHLGPASL